MPAYTAFVMGATGAVGKHLLIELQKSPLCSKVVSVSRRSVDVPLESKTKQIIVNDFDHFLLQQNPDTAYQQLFAEEPKIDVAFCCLGSKNVSDSAEMLAKIDKIYPSKFYDLVFRNNNALMCKQFSLVSSGGASATSWFTYNRIKGEVENELMQKSLQQPNRMIIFRPSFLIAKQEVGKKILKLVDWLPWINPITAEDIAKAIVQEWETYYTQQYASEQQIRKESIIFESKQTQQFADERNSKAQ